MNWILLQTINTAAAERSGSPVTAYWPVMIFFMFAIVFPLLPAASRSFALRLNAPS